MFKKFYFASILKDNKVVGSAYATTYFWESPSIALEEIKRMRNEEMPGCDIADFRRVK